MNLRINRLTDEAILSVFDQVASELFLNCAVQFSPSFGKNFPLSEIRSDPQVKRLLSLRGASFSVLTLVLPNGRSFLSVERIDADKTSDTVTVNQDPGIAILPEKLQLILALTRGLFQPHDPRPKLSQTEGFLDEPIPKYEASYRLLEAGNRELMAKVQDVLSQQITLREESFSKLTNERAQMLAEVESAKAAATAEIQSRKTDLEAKIAQFEASDSKSARRARRKAVLEEIESRQEFFEMTTGAQSKHTRVRAVLMRGIIVSISAFAFSLLTLGFAIVALKDTVGNPQGMLSEILHSYWFWGAVGAGKIISISSAVWLFRHLLSVDEEWHRKHIDAEFRHNQLYLDMSWADWLVEFTSEWRKEFSQDPPPHVVELVGGRVLGGSTGRKEEPTNDLLKQLFGSGVEGEVEFPGGKIRLNKKAMKKLAELNEAES